MTAPLRPPKLSPFQITILEMVAQATTYDRAVGYVRDWLQCNRKQAIAHITEAQQAARRIEELTQ